MPAESTIKLNVVTTADTAGLNAATQATQQLAAAATQAGQAVNPWTTSANSALATYNKALPEASRAVIDLTDKQQRMTVTTNGVTSAADKMRGGFSLNGQAMLQLSRGAQDAQYGIGGLTNNIEGITQALGAGAGLAGVLTIAAVGFDILNKNFDLFGLQAEQAADEARQLNEEMQASVDASKEAADSAEKQAASEAVRTSAIEATGEAYQTWATALERAVRAREALAAIEGQGVDAQKRLDLAKLEADITSGKVTPDQAMTRRDDIERDARRRKFEIENQKSQDLQAAAKQGAVFDRAKAGEAEKEAIAAERAAGAMLTPERRKQFEQEQEQIEKRKESLQNEIDAAEKELADAQKKAADKEKEFQRISADKESSPLMRESARRAAEDARRAAEESGSFLSGKRGAQERDKAREVELWQALTGDDQARERGGFGSRGEAIQAAKEARRKQAEKLAEAQAKEQQATQIEQERAARSGVYGTESAALEQERQNRMARERAQQREKSGEQTSRAERMEREAAERDRKEAERARGGAISELDQSVGALAGMGRGAGMNQEALTKLERLGNQVAGGDTSSGVLNALDSLLAAFGKSASTNALMASKIAKMERELTEAQAALATLKEGH